MRLSKAQIEVLHKLTTGYYMCYYSWHSELANNKLLEMAYVSELAYNHNSKTLLPSTAKKLIALELVQPKQAEPKYYEITEAGRAALAAATTGQVGQEESKEG
jgi:hypothetical protein